MSKLDIEQQFDLAGDEINALLDEFEIEGYNAGAVLGGALTALFFRLMMQSPDKSTTMGMVASAMSQASVIAAACEMADGTKH